MYYSITKKKILLNKYHTNINMTGRIRRCGEAIILLMQRPKRSRIVSHYKLPPVGVHPAGDAGYKHVAAWAAGEWHGIDTRAVFISFNK